MVDAVSIDRLRLRLSGTDAADARRLALRVAEAMAGGAPGPDPGRFIPAVRVLIAGGEPATLAPRIARAVFGRLDGETG